MNENDDRKNEFFKLLLRSQKLSERRGEGEVTEDTGEGERQRSDFSLTSKGRRRIKVKPKGKGFCSNLTR